MIKLYEFPLSPFCRKVKVVLYEKNIPFASVFVDLFKGATKAEEYLKLNPFGRVPVLIDGETVLYESTVINEYLEEKFSNPPLLPKDPVKRAKARMMDEAFDNYFMGPLGAIFTEKFMKPAGQANEAVIRENMAKLDGVLRVLEKELEGKDYLAGEFSLGDIGFAVQLPRAESMFGLKFDGYPRLQAWLKRITSRPAYQKSEPSAEFMKGFQETMAKMRGSA